MTRRAFVASNCNRDALGTTPMASPSDCMPLPPTCCVSNAPPGRRTRATSFHQTSASAESARPRSPWRLSTKSKVSDRNGSLGVPSVSTTWTPRGRSRSLATPTLGFHASVATIRGGKRSMYARTSPPPVSMSMAVDAAARADRARRLYSQVGRSSVARPRSQSKFQPTTGARSASATSRS